MVHHNIGYSFEKTGIWVRAEGAPSAKPLIQLFSDKNGALPGVVEFIASFEKSLRAFVFDADVEKKTTFCINTTAATHTTCEKFTKAMQSRSVRRSRAIETDGVSPFMERAIRKRHVEEDQAGEEEARKRRHLDADRSRGTLRTIRRLHAARESEVHPFDKQTGSSAI